MNETIYRIACAGMFIRPVAIFGEVPSPSKQPFGELKLAEGHPFSALLASSSEQLPGGFIPWLINDEDKLTNHGDLTNQ